MGFHYLDGKNWRDITREERFFCAHLYFSITGREREFVSWLSGQKNINLEIPEDEKHAEWEVGYEVCFYRDYFFRLSSDKKAETKMMLKEAGLRLPLKRTFDLCLFGPNRMIIIEAKCQQPFSSKQNLEFERDLTLLEKLLPEINVKILALASSIYKRNVKVYSKSRQLPEVFQGNFVSWRELYNSWTETGMIKNKFFEQAEELYKH